MCFLWPYILSIVNYTKGCRCHVSVILITPTVLCFTECPFPQNAAMFPVDDPTSPPLIGPSTIVVVNDARHQLQPDFLQRTTPYFFDVDENSGQYKWAKVHNSLIGSLIDGGGTCNFRVPNEAHVVYYLSFFPINPMMYGRWHSFKRLNVSGKICRTTLWETTQLHR